MLSPYLTDHRHLYRGRALAVAVPRTVEQISRLLAYCNDNRIGVVPHARQHQLLRWRHSGRIGSADRAVARSD